MSGDFVPPPGYADIAGAPPPGATAATSDEPQVIGGFFDADPGSYPDHLIRGPERQPYFEGDEFAILKSLNTEERVRLQQQMAAIGVAPNPLYGELDDTTLNGMKKLLGMANRDGKTWEETLRAVATNPALQQGAGQFEPSPHIQPDYATLAQDVKRTFRQRLGRDPEEYEMQQLTGELTGFYAVANEAQTELERIRHTQGSTPGVQAGGTVTNIDPTARFMESFEARYANELDFVEDKKEAQETEGFMQETADTVSGMARSSF